MYPCTGGDTGCLTGCSRDCGKHTGSSDHTGNRGVLADNRHHRYRDNVEYGDDERHRHSFRYGDDRRNPGHRRNCDNRNSWNNPDHWCNYWRIPDQVRREVV